MKMKMVTALFVLSLGTTASFAQTGASDGSRFGHGEDSIRCLKNISIYTEYVLSLIHISEPTRPY